MFKLSKEEIKRIDQQGLKEVINSLEKEIQLNFLDREDKEKQLEYLKQFLK